MSDNRISMSERLLIQREKSRISSELNRLDMVKQGIERKLPSAWTENEMKFMDGIEETITNLEKELVYL